MMSGMANSNRRCGVMAAGRRDNGGGDVTNVACGRATDRQNSMTWWPGNQTDQ